MLIRFQSVKPINNNMKYLKSAAITLVGYWFTRLKTFWTEDEGALINTGSWKNPWWLLAVLFSEEAQHLIEKYQRVSEEEVLILNNVPRKLRGCLIVIVQTPKNYQYFFESPSRALIQRQDKVFKINMHCEGLLSVRENIPIIPWLLGFGTHSSWNTGKSQHQHRG